MNLIPHQRKSVSQNCSGVDQEASFRWRAPYMAVAVSSTWGWKHHGPIVVLKDIHWLTNWVPTSTIFCPLAGCLLSFWGWVISDRIFVSFPWLPWWHLVPKPPPQPAAAAAKTLPMHFNSMGVPSNHPLKNGIPHYKPSILGIPHFRKPLHTFCRFLSSCMVFLFHPATGKIRQLPWGFAKLWHRYRLRLGPVAAEQQILRLMPEKGDGKASAQIVYGSWLLCVMFRMQVLNLFKTYSCTIKLSRLYPNFEVGHAQAFWVGSVNFT